MIDEMIFYFPLLKPSYVQFNIILTVYVKNLGIYYHRNVVRCMFRDTIHHNHFKVNCNIPNFQAKKEKKETL